MDKTISYLVTGGYGLIGSSIINQLDGKITLLARTDTHKARVKKNNVTVLLKNLAELEKNDIQDIDIIYHCASTVDNYNILTDPYIDVETNIKGTIRLLELCKDLLKKPFIIYLSTFFVYGNEYDKTKIPINEESKTDPLALYPATKLCAEHIIKFYSRLYKIPYLICRLTNVYGEADEYVNKKKSALNYLIMQAIKGKTLQIYEGGNFYRDYIHVNDVVFAIEFLRRGKIINDTYIIGYGKPILFKTIIGYIHNQTGRKSKIHRVESPDFHKIVGVKNFIADTSKISKLGWKPRISYQQGINQVIESYKNIINN